TFARTAPRADGGCTREGLKAAARMPSRTEGSQRRSASSPNLRSHREFLDLPSSAADRIRDVVVDRLPSGSNPVHDSGDARAGLLITVGHRVAQTDGGCLQALTQIRRKCHDQTRADHAASDQPNQETVVPDVFRPCLHDELPAHHDADATARMY